MTPSASSKNKKISQHTPLLARTLLPTFLTFVLVAGSVFFYFLPQAGDYFFNHKKEAIRELTQAALGVLQNFNTYVEAGDMSLEAAQQMAAQQIRTMRYGNEGKDYFWINDLRPIMIMHPYRPELEGTDLSDYRDSAGRPLFTDFATVAKQGGGFVSYFWQWKDQSRGEVPKLSYVQEFKPWGWVVGTGIYLNDVEAEIDTFRNRIAITFFVILGIIAMLSSYMVRQIFVAEKKRSRAQSQREKLLAALKAGEERYRTIADFAYDWEVWVSPEGVVLYCSPSCERITGYPPEAFFEDPELMHKIMAHDSQEEWDQYVKQVSHREGEQQDVRIIRKNGAMRWLGVVGRSVSGIGMKPLGLRFSFRDITDRKSMEQQLRHQALHDPLTGLANRTLCLDRIRQAISRSMRRDDYYFAIVFMDLDRFKVINDSLGHRFGDMVLVETSRRLSRQVRSLDTVARFGGDEFVFLLDELKSPREALRIVKRVRTAIAEKFSFEGHEVMTTASFGIVLSPTDSTRPENLLQNANIAMHRAKEKGRNQFKVFTSRMLESAVDLLNMENDMRRGLQNNEFHVEFQPILLMDSAALIGFEALARWNHPERGPIAPSDFIPMAEDSGLIMTLGEHILDKSIAALASWRTKHPKSDHLFVAVNLSGKQFTQADLAEQVKRLVTKHGLPPQNLKLEITETAIMENPKMALSTVSELREFGVQFSIDDFGTGYSSLTQLQRLPVDTLKVDRSFVSRLGDDKENHEIVRAVVALAHSLDLDVVAEGVETDLQKKSLADLNCECVQGFLYYKPLSMADAERIIKAQANGGPSKEYLQRRKKREQASLEKVKNDSLIDDLPGM